VRPDSRALILPSAVERWAYSYIERYMERLNVYHKRSAIQATLHQFQTSLHYAYYNIFLSRLMCNVICSILSLILMNALFPGIFSAECFIRFTSENLKSMLIAIGTESVNKNCNTCSFSGIELLKLGLLAEKISH
jgi:hypothetical protein